MAFELEALFGFGVLEGGFELGGDGDFGIRVDVVLEVALAANLIGGYLVGVAGGLFHVNTHYPLAWKLFAITSFLGD